jgi:hypothetical protein
MEPLIIARVVAIWFGSVWKGVQCYWHWRDRATQLLTACFFFLALSTPAQLLQLAGPHTDMLGIPPAGLVTEEYVTLCCAFFCIVTFFVLDRASTLSTRLHGTHLGVLIVVVAVSCIFGAITPHTVGYENYHEPHVVIMYLVTELYIAAAAGGACVACVACARAAKHARRYGYGLLALGLAILAVATGMLCAVQVNTLAGGKFWATLAKWGAYGLLIGGPVLIVGVYWIAVLIRCRSYKLRKRQQAGFGRLTGLTVWRATAPAIRPRAVRSVGTGTRGCAAERV